MYYHNQTEFSNPFLDTTPIDNLDLKIAFRYFQLFTLILILIAPSLQVIRNFIQARGSSFSNGFLCGGFLQACIWITLALYVQYTPSFLLIAIIAGFLSLIYGTLIIQKLWFRSSEIKVEQKFANFSRDYNEKSHLLKNIKSTGNCSVPAFPFVYGVILAIFYIFRAVPNVALLLVILGSPLIDITKYILEYIHYVKDEADNRAVWVFRIMLAGHVLNVLALVGFELAGLNSPLSSYVSSALYDGTGILICSLLSRPRKL